MEAGLKERNPQKSGSENIKDLSKPSEEIRNITDAYAATINRATQDIKVLVRQKEKLEKSYEQLLTINEGLVQDLALALQRNKTLEKERDSVLKANDELFQEAQRLSDRESQWTEEKAALEAQVLDTADELDRHKLELANMVCLEETSERNAKLISALKSDKSTLTAAVTKLEIDNNRLQKEIREIEEERDAILSRKEMVAGENLQLIVEAEEFRMAKSDLCNQVMGLREKCKELERENDRLKMESHLDHSQSDKFASLVEKNKNLTLWREQLIEKNQVLLEENKKLKAKCGALEELLSEEETDIGDVLELIRSVQVASKPGVSGTTNMGPISPMSSVAAKLRKYN